MKTLIRLLLLAGLVVSITSESSFGWGGWTHKRLTYWAWRYAGLPTSSGTAIVPIVWNTDSIQKTLGFQGYDMQGFLLNFFAVVSDASFSVNTQDTIKASMSDSALFTSWGRKPDDFDSPTAAFGGALFGHMYIPAGGGYADGMCKFFFDKAVREYKAGYHRKAYGYLALAAHYLEDVGFPPHNEKNYLDPEADIWQKNYHGLIEDWIGDSTNWFGNFDATCANFAKAALPACDPVMAVHGLAWELTWYDQAFKDASVKADKTELIAISKKCLQAIAPRITGLFLSFKQKTQ